MIRIPYKKVVFLLSLMQGGYAYSMPACANYYKELEEQLTLLNSSEITESQIKIFKIPSSDIIAGSKSSLIPQLRAALNLSVGDGFDKEMVQAVKSHQEFNELSPTGKVDSKTLLSILELAPEYRKELLTFSKMQCEQLSKKIIESKPARYIEINIAKQEATAYESVVLDDGTIQSTEILRTPVIVGKQATKTPLIDFDVWAVKFNPGWSPTVNILRRNIFKNGTIDYKWIQSHNFNITDSQGNRISPSELTPSNFKQFRFHEPPSENAALGKIKLETTSKLDIYMHDTPEKSKFGWNVRLASSGCIRVQKIEELSKWIWGATEESNKSFDRYLSKEKNSIRKIENKVPVYFTYRLVDDKEEQYFPDVYGEANHIVPKFLAPKQPEPIVFIKNTNRNLSTDASALVTKEQKPTTTLVDFSSFCPKNEYISCKSL